MADMIERAREYALNGYRLDRASIRDLLSIDPASPDGDRLGQAAREVASALCLDRAYLWAAIGLDYATCPMNCRFCSLGEAWGLVRQERIFSFDEIAALVRQFAAQSVRWIVLRTTQFFSMPELLRLARDLRAAVPGDYELGLNVGEFDADTAGQMADAGLSFVYHTLRLREGIDTNFKPEERLATLSAICQSPLKLVYLAEPLGPEHTDLEIADSLLTGLDYGASVTGCMERIPVAGTPLGSLPAVSERRLAQCIAVSRLAAGRYAPDICVHRASKLAMDWGANVTVVETGAVPRDACGCSSQPWNRFDADQAKAWFIASGYQVHARGL